MGKTTVRKARLVFDAKATLGEGPVWDGCRQMLFWVDIEGKILHLYDPSTSEKKRWPFDEMPGAAVPKEDGNILLALEKGLATFNFETETLARHPVLENTDPMMRYNDGKVGPNGHFYIGSMHKEFKPGSGNLYRISKDFTCDVQVTNTTISNGMAWSADHKTLYYIDSPTYTVFSFDFEIRTGLLSNKNALIKVPESYGSPDGMCIDSENMLWVAHWGGHCIRRWNPHTGAILETIEVDAPQVTSCCFGGKDLKTLYITTARSGLSPEELKEFPLSGGLFAYESNIKGTPINYF